MVFIAQRTRLLFYYPFASVVVLVVGIQLSHYLIADHLRQHGLLETGQNLREMRRARTLKVMHEVKGIGQILDGCEKHCLWSMYHSKMGIQKQPKYFYHYPKTTIKVRAWLTS